MDDSVRSELRAIAEEYIPTIDQQPTEIPKLAAWEVSDGRVEDAPAMSAEQSRDLIVGNLTEFLVTILENFYEERLDAMVEEQELLRLFKPPRHIVDVIDTL